MKIITALAILFASATLHADVVSDAVDLKFNMPKKAWVGDPANAAYWKENLPVVKAAVEAIMAEPNREVSKTESDLGAVYFQYATDQKPTPENIALLRRFGLESQMLWVTMKTPEAYAQAKADGWAVNGVTIKRADLRFIYAVRYQDWQEADQVLAENAADPGFWANGNTVPAYRAWFAKKIAGKSPQEAYDFAVTQGADLEPVDSNNARSVVEFLNAVADSRYLMLQRQRALDSTGR